jgi:hypothetical protein
MFSVKQPCQDVFPYVSGTGSFPIFPEEEEGISPLNVEKTSHLDAAVCLRIFHYIL